MSELTDFSELTELVKKYESVSEEITGLKAEIARVKMIAWGECLFDAFEDAGITATDEVNRPHPTT